VRVAGPIDDGELNRYGRPPFFNLDAYVPGQPGGTGQRLPGEYVAGVRRPFLLAGGLGPDNVREALAAVPAALGADASSRLEIAGRPGRKDLAKVRDFIAAVRKL